MTKILYIPTSTYLEFPSSKTLQESTQEFEKSVYFQYMTVEGFVATLKRMSSREYFQSSFYFLDSIICPILDTELEIIYIHD